MEEEITILEYLTTPMSELVKRPGFNVNTMQKAFVVGQVSDREVIRQMRVV